MKAESTMTAVQQWQWFLLLRRGNERQYGRSRPFAPTAPTHGSTSGYDIYGCRCDRCAEYQRAKSKRAVERQRAVSHEGKAAREEALHGAHPDTAPAGGVRQ